MRFYFVNAEGAAPYYKTQAEALKAARDIAKDSEHSIEVSKVDIPTDRENILRLANIDSGTHIHEGVVAVVKGKLAEG